MFRRLLSIAAVFACVLGSSTSALADVPISGLPAAASVVTTDIFPIVNSGTTKKATISQILNLLGLPLTAPDTAMVPVPGRRLVCFGDSITQGTGSTFGTGNAWCLHAATSLGLTAVNLGIGGTTLQAQTGNSCSGITRWNVDPPPDPNLGGCGSQGDGSLGVTTTSTAITLNASAQSVQVGTSNNIVVGRTVVVDTGVNAENVVVTAIADGTHFSGIFTKNHLIGIGVLSGFAHSLLWYAQNYTAGDVFVLAYGMNDSRVHEGASPAFSFAQFNANYQTIINGLHAAGVPYDSIIVSGIAFSNPMNCAGGCSTTIQHFENVKAQYNEQAARVALHFNTRYAETYFSMSEGGGLTLVADNLHPNDGGHSVIASQVVAANYADARGAAVAYKAWGAMTQWDANGCSTTALAFAYLSQCSTDTAVKSIYFPLGLKAQATFGTSGDSTDAIHIVSTISGGYLRVGNYSGGSVAGVNCAALLLGNGPGAFLACLDVNGRLGLSGGVFAPVAGQGAAGQWAKRIALVAGIVTWSFPASYASAPICTATEEGNGRSVAILALNTTAIQVASTVTTGNTDNVDIICVGNPN